MPRSHARISLSIWSDGDWTDLPMAAQWLYAALISQPGINQAGVLDVTARRWALLAADCSGRLIGEALDVLAARRYVVIDSDTEELLVRTFIRNDEVWRQPNTLKNACTAARSVQSPKIRGVLRDELLKLNQVKIEGYRTPEGHEPVIDVLRETIKILDGGNGPRPITPSEGYAEPIDEPNGDTSNHARAGAGAGVGVRTSSLVPKNSSSVGAPSKLRGARLPEGFVVPDEWLAWARRDFPQINARLEAAKFVDHWHAAAGQQASKRDWKAAWRNWIRKTDEMGPRRPVNGSPRPPLPTDAEAAFVELRQRADAQGAARLARITFIAESQPPSDPTDPAEWARESRRRWLDQRKPQIIEALTRKARA
jgi:hypothetical protein